MANRTKQFKTVDAIVFLDTAEKLGIGNRELSAALGYSDSAADNWIKEGRMPTVASLACEALIRRRAPRDEDRTFTVVTQVEQGRVTSTRCLTKPGTIELNGAKYLLIPMASRP